MEFISSSYFRLGLFGWPPYRWGVPPWSFEPRVAATWDLHLHR